MEFQLSWIDIVAIILYFFIVIGFGIWVKYIYTNMNILVVNLATYIS